MNFDYKKIEYINNENDENDENDENNESCLLLNDKDDDCCEYYSNYNSLEDHLTNQINYINNCKLNSDNIDNNHFIYDNNSDNSNFETIEDKESRITALILNYEINYNIKYLEHILAYYDVQKKKMNKLEMIETIVNIEDNPDNEHIVMRRKEMFKYIELLKKDKYFSKFIVFNN